jgi:hypothetical protein
MDGGWTLENTFMRGDEGICIAPYFDSLTALQPFTAMVCELPQARITFMRGKKGSAQRRTLII